MADSKNKLLNALDEAPEVQQSGANTGYFCRASIKFGYKVFATGVNQESSFFEFDPYLKKTAEVALEKAKAFAAEHGVTSSPAKSISLTLHRETIKGRTVTWSGDLNKLVARWMPAYEKVWLPALEKLNITQPGDHWVHIALVNDPSGRTEKFKDPNTSVERDVPQKVWVPDQVFPNEQLCEKAALEAAANAGTAEATLSGTDVPPPGFTPQIWAQYKNDVLAGIADGKDESFKKVSTDWGIPEETLRQYAAK